MQRQEIEQDVDHGTTLLIVEDDLDIQAALAELFQLSGYDVVLASSGATAIDTLHTTPVDLVLLDVMLPDQTGYEVCQNLRNNGARNVPIVMLTALGQPSNVTKGLSSGADDYVKKPFQPDELLLRVQRLIQRSEETRHAEQEAASLRSTLELVQRQLETSRGETAIEATLRREFLHNVSTHMQALHGIVDAALRRLPPSSEREVVQQIKSRIASAALVYQMSEALQNDPVAIDNLTQTIALALKRMYRPWKRVQLTVQGAAGDLPATIASPLAMIVNELITNCFKHAFPENRFGTITISTAQDRAFSLTIADDGVGFDAHAPHGGRGCATVTQLVQGLNGSVTWHSSATGTTVALEIPL